MADDDLPDMIPIKSSNVEAIGHHAGRRELHVKFKGGGHYVFSDVGPDLHRACVDADSVGSFLHQNIKGKFTGRKL